MDDRRSAVPFDPDYFAKRAADGNALEPEAAFRHAYETSHWAGPESRSGPGASRDQTSRIRSALPEMCHRLGIRTLLDLPCGDFHWMADVDLGTVRYIGADLLPELIAENVRHYAAPNREFRELDLTVSPLPAADMLLCRDCLVHLSFADIRRVVVNVASADIKFLLTTTFPAQPSNADIVTGDWRPLNLQAPPFSWPPPLELLNEGCTEGAGLFADKSLGLWRVNGLPR